MSQKQPLKRKFSTNVRSLFFSIISNTLDTAKPDTFMSQNEKKFSLPISGLVSKKTQSILIKSESNQKNYVKYLAKKCPPIEGARIENLPSIRQCQADFFYKNNNSYISAKARYKTVINEIYMGGVYTEVFAPTTGVSIENQEKVLINLHGGGFISGSRTASRLESIPIAATGEIKVVSVDYRMAPEYQFPAASDDVITVYKTLLQDYQPENIGIFGCSAGALLTAQTIAILQKKNLPLPGAVAMSCGAAYFWSEGNSGDIVSAITDLPLEGFHKNPYFKGVSHDNPLAFPGKFSKVLEKFPPSLLIASTRDFALSSVVKTHSELIRLGVKTELHVWEGLEHSFILNPEFPESQEAYRVIVSFFNENLGKL